MLVNAVVYTFPAAKVEAAAAMLRSLRAASRAEPGCITFDVSRSNDDPNAFVLYEEWRDQGALAPRIADRQFARIETGVGDVAASAAGNLYFGQEPGGFFKDKNFRVRLQFGTGQRGKKARRPAAGNDDAFWIHPRKNNRRAGGVTYETSCRDSGKSASQW